MRSADVDGTNLARLYSSRTRQVDNLSISRDGSRVAFTTYRKGRRAQVLVSPVAGAKPVDVLRKAPSFPLVGPIGWSPSGRRLVFEAAVRRKTRSSAYPRYLFTIRADGDGLRRLRQVRTQQGVGGGLYGNIAWTADGIFYEELFTIRRLRGGKSQVLFTSASGLYPTGDGSAIFFSGAEVGPDGPEQGIYRASTDDPEKKVLVARLPDPELGLIHEYYPNRDGSRLLARRSDLGGVTSSTITYSPTVPRDVDVLEFVEEPLGMAWY